MTNRMIPFLVGLACGGCLQGTTPEGPAAGDNASELARPSQPASSPTDQASSPTDQASSAAHYAFTTEYAAEGDGTHGDPHLLCHAEQLANLANDPRAWDRHFRLVCDIDLTSYYEAGGAQFQIGPDNQGYPDSGHGGFSGTFDGNGHSITGFKLSYQERVFGGGLFRVIMEGARVHDLDLVDSDLAGYQLGTLAASMEGGEVENVRAVNVTINSYDGAGGLVANMTGGRIVLCSASGEIAQGGKSGGLVAVMRAGLIERSHTAVSLDVPLGRSVGGFVYDLKKDAVIRDCYATGDVLVRGGLASGGAGGFAAICEGRIERAYATGNVTSRRTVGGFAAFASASAIEHAFSVGNVLATRDGGAHFVENARLGTKLTNTHFWSGHTCVAGSRRCSTTDGVVAQPSLEAFYDPAQQPLAAWDFSAVWQDNSAEGTFPTLKGHPVP